MAELSDLIAKARSEVLQEKAYVNGRFDDLERALVRAANNAREGNLGAARACVNKALDLEYDLTGDCAATGPVADELGIPED